MFAGTGSTISAATVPAFALKSDAISSRSLKGAIRVSRAAPAGTPGAAREQRVGVTVVAAVELDQCVLPGGRASEADRRHRGLRAGGHEADLFDRRHHLDDPLGELHLGLGRQTEGRSA
jgi:hypothetical protein